jgi:hypothetical protein
MAPGLRRSALYALLACALIALALLPPRPPRETDERPPLRADIRAARQLTAATERLALLALRDSVMERVRSPGAFSPDSLAFVVPGTLPARVGAVVRGLVTPLWSRAIDGTPRVRGVVVIEVDTIDVWRGFSAGRAWTRVSHILPEAIDGHTCIARIAIGMRDARDIAATGTLNVDVTSEIRARVLGTCGFTAAFGLPGAGIRSWLALEAHLPAAHASWLNDPLADAGEPRYGDWWQQDLDFGFVGCASGDLERCRATLWSPPGEDRGSVQFTEIDVPGVVVGPPYYEVRGPLGPSAQTFLADMVAHYGRERFARFWTSDAPLDEAFESAMGEPIAKWTMQRARAYIGVPDVGTRTRAMPALLSVLFSLVVVGGAGALTRLRQVG